MHSIALADQHDDLVGDFASAGTAPADSAANDPLGNSIATSRNALRETITHEELHHRCFERPRTYRRPYLPRDQRHPQTVKFRADCPEVHEHAWMEHPLTERALDLQLTCSSCGQRAAGWRGQQITPRGIGWFVEWECPNCGLVSDDYGDGPGPEDLRRGLLESFGGYGVRLVEGRDGTVPAVKHLRKMFGYTPAEALAKFKESRTGGSLGTAVEAEAVVQALRRDGYAYEAIATPPGN